LQRLGNTLAGRDEDVIVENGVISPVGSRPAGYTGPWIEQAQQATAPVAAQPADNTDPFAMLDQLHEMGLKQVTPLFDSQEQVLTSQVGKIKGDLYKQYLVEVEGIDGLGLDREQTQKRLQQLKTKYKMAYTKSTSEIEPAMQELALERQKAVSHVDAAHAERTLRVNQVQALADKGLIDPTAAKQEQLGILGYNVPISTLRPDKGMTANQRLGQLRPVYSDLLKQSAQYRNTPTGWRVFDADAKERYPSNPQQWYKTPATPEQAIEAEDIQGQLVEVGDQLKELRRTVGSRPTLTDDVVPPTKSPLAAGVANAKDTSPRGGKIAVWDPQGRLGYIPQAELTEALASGYTQMR
jgi:hypothetical protein